jgi:hypothetical protein
MTKTRLFLFATLAVIVVFGQMALAADAPRGFAKILGPAPGFEAGLSPDVAPTLANTVTFATGASATLGFCGPSSSGMACPSDPVGTMIFGEPEETGYSAATCTSTTAACGVVWNFFESNTATGDWKTGIKITQGTKVIEDSGLQDTKQTFPVGEIGASGFYLALGPGNCPKAVTCVDPVAGPATIVFTEKIGAKTITGRATITLLP